MARMDVISCLTSSPARSDTSFADGAYDGDETREQVKRLKAKACIKRFRRVATRYEKSIENYAVFFWVADMVSDML